MSEIKNREKYEWARLWFEEASNPSLPRILLIGDSITAGYRPFVNELMNGKAVVDQLATSGAINDPLYLKQISLMLSEYPYKAIHFNNGLHGWHLKAAAYEESLKIVIDKIRELQENCILILATTTPSTVKGKPSEINLEKDKIIRDRNSILVTAASEYKLDINDLYSHIEGRSELRSDDGSHYTQEGYRILAEKVTECLQSVVQIQEQ